MYMVKPGMADSLAQTLQGALSTCSTTSTSWTKSTTPPWSRPLVGGSRVVLWKGVDAGLIDGIVNGVGARCRDVGSVLRLLQSGNIRSYATWVLFGSVALILAMGLSGGLPDEPPHPGSRHSRWSAFLVALAIPRSSSAQGSRMWALVSSLAIFVASLGLLAWFDRDAAASSSCSTCPGSPLPTFTSRSR